MDKPEPRQSNMLADERWFQKATGSRRKDGHLTSYPAGTATMRFVQRSKLIFLSKSNISRDCRGEMNLGIRNVVHSTVHAIPSSRVHYCNRTTPLRLMGKVSCADMTWPCKIRARSFFYP
jgi:hypothetical protein